VTTAVPDAEMWTVRFCSYVRSALLATATLLVNIKIISLILVVFGGVCMMYEFRCIR